MYIYVCVCSFFSSFFYLFFFMSFFLSFSLSFFLSFFLSCLLSSLYFVLSFSPLCLIHLIWLDTLCFDTVRCIWEHLNLPQSIALADSALQNFTYCCLAKIHNKGSSFNTCKKENVVFQEKISVTGIEKIFYMNSEREDWWFTWICHSYRNKFSRSL